MNLKQKTKHSKESEYWLNQTSTSNHYTALLEEESEDQLYKAGPENTPKSLLIDIIDVKYIISNTKVKPSQTVRLQSSLKLQNATQQA
jgi:hypothetical protein